MGKPLVTVMGSYVTDLAFLTDKLPAWGETYMGSGFRMGPGGKGSNQAVAAARAGARVSFISKLGRDLFGDLARKTYRDEGIETTHLLETDTPTGAASIVIDAKRGENSIVVVPGACFELTPEEVAQARELIAGSAVFVTQLELAVPAVEFGLELAHSLGVLTILNPAPGRALPASIFPHCDYVTPNETEAEIITGVRVTSLADAERAADALLARGARNAVITLGAQGALVKNAALSEHVPACRVGDVVDTTGAGDAFNGGFAVALAEGRGIVGAACFGCAVAGISVTRPGTAPSMPQRCEVDALLRGNR
ncbi:MAG TPA: ribokinase [Acidobacteriaceae bacterium]|nr:ribokinase [Acidobacteriaceae bacterium]